MFNNCNFQEKKMQSFYHRKKILSTLVISFFCGMASASPALAEGEKLCREKKYQQAYPLLEKAAEKGNARAWSCLGKLYFQGCGIPERNLRWAELCFLASEKIKKDPQNAWYLGLIRFESGDIANARKYLQFAAAKNHKKAAAFLKKIDSVKHRPPQKKAVRKVSISDLYTQCLTTIQKYFDTQIISPAVSEKNDLKMLRLPYPENIRIKGWDFSFEDMENKIAAKLISDREGNTRLKYEEFEKCPIEENLAAINPTIRFINAQGVDAMFEAMKKAKFKQCPKAELNKFLTLTGRKETINDENYEYNLWQIRDDLYFLYEGDFSGRWQVRSYSFFRKIGSKFHKVTSFGAPPDAEDAVMTEGIIRKDPICLLNYAVRIEENDLEQFESDSETAVEILTVLDAMGNPAATYNLGIFHLKNGDRKKAEKYFNAAQKAGLKKYLEKFNKK